MTLDQSQYSVNIEFHAVSLPPVKDILVLGKKHPNGKLGVMESFRFIAPDEFEMFDVPEPEEAVEAVVINKRILQRMPPKDVIAILREHVFPYVSKGEAINVDFNIKIRVSGIERSRAL